MPTPEGKLASPGLIALIPLPTEDPTTYVYLYTSHSLYCLLAKVVFLSKQFLRQSLVILPKTRCSLAAISTTTKIVKHCIFACLST